MKQDIDSINATTTSTIQNLNQSVTHNVNMSISISKDQLDEIISPTNPSEEIPVALMSAKTTPATTTISTPNALGLLRNILIF